MPSVTRQGIAISYSDTGGDGTPVVLVHGFPFNSSLWDPQVESLGDRFRVIAPDLMGFGDSDAPEDPSAYSIAVFSDQIRAVVDDTDARSAVLCGLSMGGYVCLDLWRRHRDVIKRLVLADTRAEPDTPDAQQKRSDQQEQIRAEGTRRFARTLVGELLSETSRSRPDVSARALAAMDNPPQGFVGALEAMKARPDSTADLVTIDVPTLIVVGEQDAITPPDAARTMHEHIGGSQLVVIPEAGHVSNLEAPEAFSGALARFVAAGRG
jgi:3-oxoadipate enol-lactonase